MKTTLKLLTITIFVSLLASTNTFAGNVSGTMLNDTTWTVAGGDVVVTATFIIPLGKTLTIEPGVSIKFNSGTSLIVNGKIIAEGTESDRIVFTSNSDFPAPGSWGSIEFGNTSNVNSVFSYVTIEGGGAGTNNANIFYKTGAFSIQLLHVVSRVSSGHGVNLRASSPNIFNSEFSNNNMYGIFSDLFTNFNVQNSLVRSNLEGGIRIPVNSTPTINSSIIDSNYYGIYMDNGSVPVITNNLISGNSTGIQFIGLGSAQPTIKQNEISGNLDYGINNSSTQIVNAELNYWGANSGPYHPGLNPTGLGNSVGNYIDFQPWNVSTDLFPVKNISTIANGIHVWYPDTVYRITANLAVNAEKSLTIKPGTIVKFNTGISMTVSSTGILQANGNSDSLIVFTSFRDDSYGGDSNADGNASGPNPGDWNELLISTNSSNSSVTYAIVKFGGNSSYNFGIVNSTPTVHHVYVNNSKNDGLQIENTTISLNDLKLSANGRHGLRLHSNATLNLQFSNINYNTFDGISFTTIGSQRIELLSQVYITNNGGNGIYAPGAIGTNTIQNNYINDNGGSGFWSHNVSGLNIISNNVISNNGQHGIVSTSMTVTNNQIINNQYPIVLHGTINNTYSGNSISGNVYNNILGLSGGSTYPLKGTLKVNHPESITSGAYAVISSLRINNNDSLIIDPGVVLKFGNYDFNVYGKLVAQGTEEHPIIFTSHRDHSHGGKTNLSSDGNPAAPGNWGRIYFSLSGTNTSKQSRLNHIIMKYGGSGNSGNIVVEDGTLQNAIENVRITNGSSYGFYFLYSKVSLNNVQVDSMASYGIRLYGQSHNVEINITNSVLTRNGSHGLFSDYEGAVRLFSNNTVSFNGNHGVFVENGLIPQTYLGNQFINNNGTGLVLYSPTKTTDEIQIIGNTFSGNAQDGLRTTRAKLIDNQFFNNRYPVVNWTTIGNIYTDNDGVDGNIFTGNLYNNTIGIIGDNSHTLIDTIYNRFPQAITSKAYTVISDVRLNNGNTLVISPGVKLKYALRNIFYVYGKLVAKGTEDEPIMMTSWKDESVGGKTNLLSETDSPTPGDWGAVYLYDSGNTYTSEQSEFSHLRIKYSGYHFGGSLYLENVDMQHPFENSSISYSSSRGIYLVNSKMTISGSTIFQNNIHGIEVNSGNYSGELIVRNSVISQNTQFGLFANASSNIREITNSQISNNIKSGVVVFNGNIPMSLLGNEVNNNAEHGIYIRSKNDAVDTLILSVGNLIKNNGLVGIQSSRAVMVSDSILNNRYGIGGIGQLSRSGINEFGNHYEQVVVQNNLYNNAFTIQEFISGQLGYSFPDDQPWVVTVRGDVKVNINDSLIVAPGTVIKFPLEYGSGYFDVDGKIIAKGNYQHKIVFTSFKDDTYGGDTNQDSIQSIPAKGNWGRIYLNGGQNSASILKNVIVRYGGVGLVGNIYVNGASPIIDSSYVSYSSNYGIYLNNSSAELTNSEIHQNTYGIYVVNNASNPFIRYNNFYNNSHSAIFHSTTTNISAIHNYWGDVTGPLVNQGSDQNLSGLGNRIFLGNSGQVAYRPFYTTRSGVLAGDVTENGSISAFDASYVLQYVVSSRELSGTQLAAADVSGDGSVSAFDASLILQYVVGIISGFPSLGKIEGESVQTKIISERKGDMINLYIRFDGANSIKSSDLTFSYLPDYLTVQLVQSTLDATNVQVLTHTANGKVKFAITGTQDFPTASDLVHVQFKLKDELTEKIDHLLTLESFRMNELDQLLSLKTSDFSDVAITLPETFVLEQNYPNPFNPTTKFNIHLPLSGHLNVTIYNLLGQKIKTIVDAEQIAGIRTFMWDGKNDQGQTVSSGMYMYKAEVKGENDRHFVSVKRMMMLK